MSRSAGIPFVGKWSAILIGVGLCFGEAGCSDFNTKHLKIGEAAALATRADIRIITERADPYPVAGEKHPTVVCAEPSPDVALALSKALTAEAHAKTPTGIEAGANAGYRTSEAALALAGRTSAVVALRDGLYRACEGYANGIIGRDSYALILSQYGDLLVTLILGDSAATNEGVGSTVSTTTGAAPAAPSPGGGTDKNAPPAAAPAPQPAAPAAPKAQGAGASAAVFRRDGDGPGVQPSLLWLASSPSPPTKKVQKPKAKTPPAAAKQVSQTAKATPTPATTTIAETKADSPAEGIAKAYFGGEHDRLLKAMFVVCTAEAERRRARSIAFPDPVPGRGDYFDQLCTIDLQILATIPAEAKAPKP